MKAFISVDLEGLPYIVIPGQLWLKGSLFEEARKIATELTIIVAEELKANGFEEVIIADSHGAMVNILVESLPEYVEIIRGNPRPVSMVTGVEDCDVAIFLGYHAKSGTTKSSFDHTYSGATIHQVEVNNTPASEFLLNAYVAGEYKVPVILVAGEAQLLDDDVKQFISKAEMVPLKRSLSRIAARSFSMVKIKKELQEATKRAVGKFRNKEIKPLKIENEITMKITFRSSLFADVAELLPIIRRISGLTVEYNAKTMVEAYKIFQLLVIAAGGINSYLEKLQ